MSIPLEMYVSLHAIFIDSIVNSPSHNKRLDISTIFKERKQKFSNILGEYFPTKTRDIFNKNPWRVFSYKISWDFHQKPLETILRKKLM